MASRPRRPTDVVGRDRCGFVELLDRLLGLAVGDVVDRQRLAARFDMSLAENQRKLEAVEQLAKVGTFEGWAFDHVEAFR
jgi:hypothetical protein